MLEVTETETDAEYAGADTDCADDDSDNMLGIGKCIDLVNMAIRAARDLSCPSLEARGLYLLATFYAKCSLRRAAAPALYDLSAKLHLEEGEPDMAVSSALHYVNALSDLGDVDAAVLACSQYERALEGEDAARRLMGDRLVQLVLIQGD